MDQHVSPGPMKPLYQQTKFMWAFEAIGHDTLQFFVGQRKKVGSFGKSLDELEMYV